MSLPAEVNVTSIKDGFEFDRGGNIVKIQTWTYFASNHGPFTQKFYAGELQPDHIARVISDHVAGLRTLGVLS